ncbi:MAG: hypothetical protein GY856_17855 [bacterium]|nr:hypothetical protein [bacterium]
MRARRPASPPAAPPAAASSTSSCRAEALVLEKLVVAEITDVGGVLVIGDQRLSAGHWRRSGDYVKIGSCGP